jgi:hypothetical protein
MADRSAGRFYAHRADKDRIESLSSWRVTTDLYPAAQEISRLLGGDPQEIHSQKCDRWEIATRSSAVEIFVQYATEAGIAFSLEKDRDLGIFLFHSTPWTMTEIMRGGKEFCMRRGELSIEPVQFRTLNGLQVHYRVPALRVLDSSQ